MTDATTNATNAVIGMVPLVVATGIMKKTVEMTQQPAQPQQKQAPAKRRSLLGPMPSLKIRKF